MHFCAFLRIIPKWFLTITCTIWLRLQFRGQDSAQNFGAHLLFFQAPGWILGPLVRFSGLGVDIPARGRFWLVLGCRKRWFCRGIILWGVGREIHPAQMNSNVCGTHLGRLLCPKPWFFVEICVISHFPENWKGSQPISWWDPYSPRGIPIVPVGSLCWRNKVPMVDA